MPKYTECMPGLIGSKGGLWISGTCMTVPEFGFEVYVHWYRVFRSSRNAYRHARFRALIRAMLTAGSDYGVQWQVAKVKTIPMNEE